ncbi:MAG: fumarylacetoacetate hydrolase family protein, partial [Pyrinomonadaceae bacterium]
SKFEASTTLPSLKRESSDLVEYLFRENSFPADCFLLTDTGIIPDNSFTLHSQDEIRISHN